LARIQVQSARISDTYETIRSADSTLIIIKHNIESYLIDTAMIYAGASALFDYSRRRKSELPTEISWDDVRKVFFTYHFDNDDYPSLLEHVSLIEKGGSKPFER
jgi:hypothetical protein